MINLSKNDTPNPYNPAPKAYDSAKELYLWEIKDTQIWAKSYMEAIQLFNQIDQDYGSHHTETEI